MDKKLSSIIGTSLRMARERRGWTQRKAAQEVGLSHEFYARIERGQALPSTPSLIRVADALGLSVHSILAPAIEMEAAEIAARELPPEISYIVEFARKNPDDVHLLLLAIRVFDEAGEK